MIYLIQSSQTFSQFAQHRLVMYWPLCEITVLLTLTRLFKDLIRELSVSCLYQFLYHSKMHFLFNTLSGKMFTNAISVYLSMSRYLYILFQHMQDGVFQLKTFLKIPKSLLDFWRNKNILFCVHCFLNIHLMELVDL